MTSIPSPRGPYVLARIRRMLLGVVIALTSLSIPVASLAKKSTEAPENGGFTRSMGIPTIYRMYAGFEGGVYRPTAESLLTGLGNVGFYRYKGSPVVGAMAFGLEGYAGVVDQDFDYGGRALFHVPVLQFATGVDYNVEDDEFDFLLRVDLPIHRGGVLRGGSTISCRWLPTRDQSFSVGLTFPFGDPNVGKTRPKDDYVALDDRKPDRARTVSVAAPLASVLRTMDASADWISRMTQPFAEHRGADPREAMEPHITELLEHMALTDERFPNGHTLNEEIRVYHESLDLAFSIALSQEPMTSISSEGARASENARRILLDDVILPYNYHFGQRKEHDSLYGLIGRAQTDFARVLLADFELSPEVARTSFFVFQTLCDAVERNREALRDRWQDTRFVWLPLQYGARPEDHDTQDELNQLIERATREEFKNGNFVWYIINEQFQWEMARSVRYAEDYHILWIHDIAGVNGQKKPDALAYHQVRNYFEALTDRVRDYSATGKIPVYMIFLDQHFFETNKGRLWTKLLQDPMRYDIDLPDEFEEWERNIEDLQEKLREAVDSSLMLQVERSQYGEEWLYNRIKVHVNITNPADPSFYSHHVLNKMLVPDNNMRDHRKMVVYDVTEEDPYRGFAMFTGMGIGEHYVGSNWEDRALMLQGPEALEAKNAARELLTIQGFDADEIPFPLRPVKFPKDYDDKVEAEVSKQPEWIQDHMGVLQLHNETGFTPKPINIAQAVLYSLMPSGSVIKAPDSLWQSYINASLLAGSSLRGCRVLIIAPGQDTAPSAGAPQMTRAFDLMGRLIVFGSELDEALEAEGGIFKVGIYSPQQGVADIAGRMEQGVRLETDWSDRVYDFHPEAREVALRVRAQLDSIGYKIGYLSEADSLSLPKLHLKANYFASPQGWDDFMAQPEWAEILRQYIVYLADQVTPDATDDSQPDVQRVPDAFRANTQAFFTRYYADLSQEERERMILYFTVGSVNMDYRSHVLNGEVMVTLSGFRSLIGVLDFIFLSGLCEWPETPEELAKYMNEPSGMQRRIANFIRLML